MIALEGGNMLATHRLLLRVFVFMLVVLATCFAMSTHGALKTWERETFASEARFADGLAAWDQVYSVLTSPRCINCHTATNYPQQGDDRHRHFANVIRGPDGKGVPALNCVSCHQTVNADSTGVPGGPDWHLAPLSMRWQDTNDQPLSSAAVCRAVTDRSRNENMDGRALLKHHEEAALVLWAWNPGRRPDGTSRTLPPLTHPQFVAATRTWVEAGTPCPRSK
jgi:mono/diheme cytochrome c family protein